MGGAPIAVRRDATTDGGRHATRVARHRIRRTATRRSSHRAEPGPATRRYGDRSSHRHHDAMTTPAATRTAEPEPSGRARRRLLRRQAPFGLAQPDEGPRCPDARPSRTRRRSRRASRWTRQSRSVRTTRPRPTRRRSRRVSRRTRLSRDGRPRTRRIEGWRCRHRQPRTSCPHRLGASSPPFVGTPRELACVAWACGRAHRTVSVDLDRAGVEVRGGVRRVPVGRTSGVHAQPPQPHVCIDWPPPFPSRAPARACLRLVGMRSAH